MNYFERANELKEELSKDRRYIHENAEVGMELPKACEYVMTKLKEMGYAPKIIGGSGVTATVGNRQGKTILLRADMDALPMKEESGEPFACKSGEAAHTCGHDLHTAMLLGAAKMLKENEKNIKGTVKLMFQPGEEIFKGSKALIEEGILESPKVDAALAYHVGPGKMPVGLHMYNDKGTMMYSNDGFKITVHGKGAHGAYPHQSIDPIHIAVQIYLGLEEIIAREVDSSSPCVMTIGKLVAGEANNIIPETAVIEGSIRTTSIENRNLMVSRMKEVACKIAEVYRGSAEVEMISEVPPLICNKEFTKEILSYMSELDVPGQMGVPDIEASASDDFAVILEKVPGAYMFLSAGYPDKDVAPSHNPKVIFNEEVLPIGAAYLAHCAARWLENNK